ncbi:MAG: M64 family metallopeptidase [Muribaculaceae bacterium]
MAVAAMASSAKTANNEVEYSNYFANSTLRIDYQFMGDAKQQGIVLDALSCTDLWAGRRHNLDQMPLKGNGQLEMRDAETGKVIYRTSFSSLFLEWIATDEAKTTPRSFEHTVLVPLPLRPVDVTTTLINASLQTTATYSHRIDPADILIEHKHRRPDLDYCYVHKGGSVERAIDVVILGEGYDQSERDLFYADAQATRDALFSHEPFKSRSSEFNIVAVFTPSEQSGMSIPRLGIWRNTAFGSHFSTFYSDRYLTTSRVKSIHDAISGILYEHIIILANTDEYGGGGIYNDYTLTTAHNPNFAPVVVHEFGHSFGGLADEYQYGDPETYDLNVEPWEQNITTLKNFKSKWQDMTTKGIAIPTPDVDANKGLIGAFEGAGYNEKGMYRPTDNCRMRTNKAPAFCPVCQRALNRIIDFYTK